MGERLNRESSRYGSINMGVWTPRTQVKVDRVYDLSASQKDEKQRTEPTESHRQCGQEATP